MVKPTFLDVNLTQIRCIFPQQLQAQVSKASVEASGEKLSKKKETFPSQRQNDEKDDENDTCEMDDSDEKNPDGPDWDVLEEEADKDNYGDDEETESRTTKNTIRYCHPDY